MEQKVDKLCDENKQMSSENQTLKERLIKLGYHTQRNNFLINGIPEKQGETDKDCYDSVIEILSNLFVKDGHSTETRLEKAKKITIKPERIRPIIFNLQWYGDKIFINANGSSPREYGYVIKLYRDEVLSKFQVHCLNINSTTWYSL